MLTDKLKIRYPLIQAPMAGASSHPRLTAAVSNAGALGSYGAGYLPASEIRKVIREIRNQTDAPFNLNLFVPRPFKEDTKKIEASLKSMAPYFHELGIKSQKATSYAPSFEEQMAIVVEEKVPVFSFTFGIPEERWLQQFKDQGIVTIGTATHLAEAIELEKRGVDFIVAQGREAGGHRGTFIGREEEALLSTKELIKAFKESIKTPLIAAGGIMNREGIQEAMRRGVYGVQMGTAFLTAKECPIHPKYREITLNSKKRQYRAN